MKKAKLFMMLALLVMGVGNVFGYSYRVIFEDGVINGGYTVKANSGVTTGNDAYVLESSEQIDAGNYSNYITLRQVDGNDVDIVVDKTIAGTQMGFDGVIYITYNSNVTDDKLYYNDDDPNYIYSNIYTRTDGRTGWNQQGEYVNYPRVTSKIYLGDEQVAISLNNNSLVNAVIPLTYNGKRVVAIQKWGFCYSGNDVVRVESCQNVGTNNSYNGSNEYYGAYGHGYGEHTNDHKNDYLKTVTFEKNSNGTSNLKSIGDYAFMSCKVLESVEIPSSVKFMGQAIFSQDDKLASVTFQTKNVTRGDKTFRGTEITTIRNFTFWMCTALKTLNLPDGIVFIEGQTAGAAMQYMTGLINLRLPNTLERVGPHFLCCAQALKTLTVPVSVTYLDGACFHGCESLETVYILGPAGTLKAEDNGAGGNATTFGPNTTYCAEPVHDCTFYTTTGNLAGYQENSVWSRIDNKKEWVIQTTGGGWFSDGNIDPNKSKFGNQLLAMGENRVIPDHWVTAIFPTKGSKTGTETVAVADRTEAFGKGTLVAEMDRCTGYTDDEIGGVKYRTYHLNFKLITGNTIPANKPLLIKAGEIKEDPYEFYTPDDQKKSWFTTNASVDFEDMVTASDKAKIYMRGKYLGHQLEKGDFYFMDTQGNDGSYSYSFKRVPNQENAAYIKGCRCWWTVEQNNMRSVNVGAKAASQRFFDDETTGIEELPTRVVIDAIYDLNGHKLNVKPEELPQGLFIMNGKKGLKK